MIAESKDRTPDPLRTALGSLNASKNELVLALRRALEQNEKERVDTLTSALALVLRSRDIVERLLQ